MRNHTVNDLVVVSPVVPVELAVRTSMPFATTARQTFEIAWIYSRHLGRPLDVTENIEQTNEKLLGGRRPVGPWEIDIRNRFLEELADRLPGRLSSANIDDKEVVRAIREVVADTNTKTFVGLNEQFPIVTRHT